MGTRSLTRIVDEQGKTLATIYRQFDGYPSGLGQELADFLKARTLCNGISGNATAKTHANGMGCLAAQLITHLKADAIGSVYIYPPESKDVGEEWTYTIAPLPPVGEGWDAHSPGFKFTVRDRKRIVFDGSPAEFNAETLSASSA